MGRRSNCLFTVTLSLIKLKVLQNPYYQHKLYVTASSILQTYLLMCKMNIDLLLKYLDIFFFISDFSSDVFISLVIYLSCSFVFTLFIIIGFVMPGLVFFVDEKINRRRRCSLSLMFTTFALPVVTISLAFQSLLYPEDHLLRVKYSSLREYDVVWESLPKYIFQLFTICRVGFDSSDANKNRINQL